MMDWITRDRLALGARLGAIAGAALFLAACEVSEASGPGPGGPGGGGYCPRNYDPVCAARGGSERTFPNSCEARSSGWFVEYRGECRRAGWDRDRDRDRGRDGWDRDRGRDRDGWDRDRDRRDRDSRDRERDRPRDPRIPPPSTPLPPPLPPAPPPPPPDAGGICPQIFDPVCGQVGTQTQRFPNECEMQRAGGSRVADGACMGGGN